MKNNRKVKLTFGQLKSMIRESIDDDAAVMEGRWHAHNSQRSDNVMLVATYNLGDGAGERMYKVYDNSSMSEAAIERLISRAKKEMRIKFEDAKDMTVYIYRGVESDFIREKIKDIKQDEPFGRVRLDNVRMQMAVSERTKVSLTLGQLRRLVNESRGETIYRCSVECEHEGDLERMCRDITEGGFAEIVSVDIPDETWSIDQYVKICFRVLDEEKFQEETDWDLSETESFETDSYIGKRCCW